MSERTRRRFCIAREAVWGAQAATPSARILRVTGNPNIDVGRDAFSSEERRQDRESALGTTGSNRTRITIPFELSYGSHDDLLEGALDGRFIYATGAQAVTLSVSVTVAASGKTFTRASGSFVTDGFAAGDFIITSGFVNAGNNGTFKITAIEATVITCADATTLVNETLASGSVYDRWGGLPIRMATVTVAVDQSDKTFTRASGSYVTDGVQVGDYIVTTGFAESANNGTFKVAAVEALIITVTSTGLTDEAAKTNTSYYSTRGVLKAGVLHSSYDIEQGQLDFSSDKYRIAKGMMVESFSLDIPLNGKITGSFGLIGNDGDSYGDTPLTSSPTAASTTPIMNSCTGSLKENGDTLAIVTGFSMALTNNAKHNFVLFSRDASGIGFGSRKITGKTSFRFTSSVYSEKYLAETETAHILEPTDSLGNKYRITLPSMKYTSQSDEGDDADIVLGLPWEAAPDTVLLTSLQIERIPI